MTSVVGRMAPSPTGILHVGNARSLLLAWLTARTAGGDILLRIEDLMPGADAHLDALLRDLDWLGLDWDAGQPTQLWQPAAPRVVMQRTFAHFMRQADRAPVYEGVLARLCARGLAYPCICTRKDIDGAARAPHAEDRGTPYPGTCRGRFANEQEALEYDLQRAAYDGRAPLGVAIRLCAPAAPVHFEDGLCGPVAVRLAQESGDFVLRRKDGGFAYMFAVVVDDLAMGVTEVVRGDDLLWPTAQQLALDAALREVATPENGDPFWQRAAHWQPPRHVHVPLVVGDDGRRLAKRNQSLHLSQLRDAGVPARRLRRWLAQSIGLPMACDLDEMKQQFNLDLLPRTPVRFGAAELAAWTLPGP